MKIQTQMSCLPRRLLNLYLDCLLKSLDVDHDEATPRLITKNGLVMLVNLENAASISDRGVKSRRAHV